MTDMTYPKITVLLEVLDGFHKNQMQQIEENLNKKKVLGTNFSCKLKISRNNQNITVAIFPGSKLRKC